MKKVALTVFGILGLAASANAQGTWYTNQAQWQSLVSNVRTADYNTLGSQSSTYTVNGITATATGGFTNTAGKLETARNNTTITFTFSGNAFCGVFGNIRADGNGLSGSGAAFTINGVPNNPGTTGATFNLNSGYRFLGYISDSSSNITSVKFSGHNSIASFESVDSFSFGQSTSSLSGSNVAPEPGSLTLAVTGGCALVGMCIRRRRMSN